MKAESAVSVLPVREMAEKVLDNVGRVIVGKRTAAELLLVALLGGGHTLVEDVPGVGKTLLAKAMARSIGGVFKRIQFTPDLLPSDVTGAHVYNPRTSQFEFRPGPIVANVVLADEINRATPRTQSCLLECMQERQVTSDGETTPLPRPFLVIATQNPIELEGTFPLPEAQLDRFLLRMDLGYPSRAEENIILSRFEDSDPLDSLETVITAGELMGHQEQVRRVYVEDSVRDYIVGLVRVTREHPSLRLGGSPRATLSLQTACQALAAVRGRGFILPDDAKYLAAPVLAHRLMVKAESRLRGASAAAIIQEVLSQVPVPVE
ncbi:MAG: MoxR family ATPase [Chloroflexi bacterium]|nr:MoxR family ATPase [Chloroflexota bacterium]